MGVHPERVLMGAKPGQGRVSRVLVICHFCYIDFPVRESDISLGSGKFCSVAHYREWRKGRNYKDKPPDARRAKAVWLSS